MSRIDGCRNLWHTIHEDGFRNDANWGQFFVDQLVEGIRRFKQRNSIWVHGCIPFLQLHYVIKFKIPSVHVPMTVPLLSAWSDELIKERLAAEISQFGSFEHGEGFDYSSPPRTTPPCTHVEFDSGPTSSHHNPEPHSDYGGDDIASHGTIDVPDTPIWHPSDIADEEVVVLEQLPLQSMVVAPSDRSGRRRRVRQLAPNLLSPFIAQPQTRQYAIKMGLKEAAAIVFYGALDPRIKLFLSPYIAEMVMRSNAKHLMHEAVIGRFEPYLYPFDVSYQNVNEVYLPVFLKNHWTLYVYDLHNKRIQLLDSRLGRRRSCMSGIQQNLVK
ncbi:unnamed protein product, partial [Vitis vinifera]